MHNYKLNIVLLTNNDHEASTVGFLLSKNNWDVTLAWSKEECSEYFKAVNTDAVVVLLDNEDILDRDLLDQITPFYPVILINNMPTSKENQSLIQTFLDGGAYKVEHNEIEDELKKTILSSVLYYRSGEMAVA